MQIFHVLFYTLKSFARGGIIAGLSTALTEMQYKRIQAFLQNEEARMSLFWILDKDGRMRRFALNKTQREIGQGLREHTRHLVLKSRQLGISTYVCMFALDRMLFRQHFKAAIVDKTKDDGAEKIDKLRFAYEHLDFLPEHPTQRDIELAAIGRFIKEYHGELTAKKPNGGGKPCVVSTEGLLYFSRTRSSIRASVTYRGGTLNLLHVSELGHMANHDPKRAVEVVTGSYQSVGKNCTVICESTHEGGKAGTHYEQVLAAMDNIGKPLSKLDFRFWFFPWFNDPEYKLDDFKESTQDDIEYFANIEKLCHTVLTQEQRNWYISQKHTLGALMRQEYPSTPDEALSPIMDGTIYAAQIMALRESGNLTRTFEPDRFRPIYTAWDLGYSDFTSIWWFQPTGDGRWLVLDNYTANRQPQDHYISIMREHDAKWGKCSTVYLPHDGDHHNNIGDKTYAEGMRRAGYSVRMVPRTQNQWKSIDDTRDLLRDCIFHARCSEATRVGVKVYQSGVEYLTNYRTDNERTVLHDENSHAADAFRCFADAVVRGLVSPNTGFEARKTGLGRQDSVVLDYLD